MISSIGVKVLDGEALWVHVTFLAFLGFAIFEVINCHTKLDSKIGIAILVVLVLIAVALFVCFAYCIKTA